MTTNKRALLLSTDDEPVDDVREQLEMSGYRVHRCVEDGAASFPCIGIGGGVCPLDSEGGVDLVVDVRQHPWQRPTIRELGVLCALRVHTPVVVVSSKKAHPFSQFTTTTTLRDEVVIACDDAIDRSLDGVRWAAGDAVRAVMDRHGVTGPVEVTVEREHDQLHVRIAADLEGPVRAMAATRAGIAVRHMEPTVQRIEVEVTP